MSNKALWLDGPGGKARVGDAPMYEPREGELLLKVKSVVAQPGEWKVVDGIVPITLTYPTIIGTCFSGIVERVGSGVSHFNLGDRVATSSASVIRDDSRFGGYQQFAITTQDSAAKIGNTSFEEAACLATAYAPASALFLHLGLDRPSAITNPQPKHETVLVWGASSSFGSIASQLLLHAGYTVVGVASGHNAELVKSYGVEHFVDRTSPDVVKALTDLGPFKTVLAAADSAEDQVKIGEVLAAHGGGYFLSTMGARQNVQLPIGVTGGFHQYMDDYLDPKNAEYARWFWTDYLETAIIRKRLRSNPTETLGGLSKTTEAWDLLRHEKASGKRLIITPDVD